MLCKQWPRFFMEATPCMLCVFLAVWPRTSIPLRGCVCLTCTPVCCGVGRGWGPGYERALRVLHMLLTDNGCRNPFFSHVSRWNKTHVHHHLLQTMASMLIEATPCMICVFLTVCSRTYIQQRGNVCLACTPRSRIRHPTCIGKLRPAPMEGHLALPANNCRNPCTNHGE